LLEFIRNCNSADTIDPEPMNILGRKLFAAFERKAGKIDRINPAISKNLAEEQLCFYQTADKRAWAVSSEVITANQTYKVQPLKRSNSLVSLLAWCQFNHLTHTGTRLSIVAGEHGINDFELQNMARSLRGKVPVFEELEKSPLQGSLRYTGQKRPLSVQLFINVGSGKDGSKVHSMPDSMAIANIEEVILNNWGEVTTRRFDGEFALIRCLREYLQMLPPGKDIQAPPLEAYCFTANRASSTASRVQQLFNDINNNFYLGSDSAHNRYVLQLQKYFFVVQFDQHRPNIERAENYQKLLDLLGKTQSHYSPARLDRHCLKGSVLATVLNSSKPDCIQVYYQQHGETADVYVVDEMGSLHSFNTPFRDEHTLLAPLDQFMHSMSFRESSEASDNSSAFSFQHYRLEYYEISGPSDALQVTRCGINGDTSMGYFFNVQAIGERDVRGRIVFNIYCDQNEFTELELGSKLYDTVAKFIIERRESHERYPCYITDLDLSRCINRQRRGNIQTTDYLRYKQKLEKALNQALQLV
jgi:adenylate cyclase class 1